MHEMWIFEEGRIMFVEMKDLSSAVVMWDIEVPPMNVSFIRFCSELVEVNGVGTSSKASETQSTWKGSLSGDHSLKITIF
jgi:hypothetical protein